MLSSITPLGERARNRRWTTTAVAYVVGSVVGGGVTGLAFGWITSWLPSTLQPAPTLRPAALAVTLALAAAYEWRIGGVAVPSIQRQVNEDWLDEFRGWVVGAGFGLQLGAGLTTIVTSASVYAVWIAAALTLSPVGGAIIGGVFGIARSLPLLATRTVTTPSRLRSWHASMSSLAGPARTITATACLVIATVLIATSTLGGAA